MYTDTDISGIGQYQLILLAKPYISLALFKNQKTKKTKDLSQLFICPKEAIC